MNRSPRVTIPAPQTLSLLPFNFAGRGGFARSVESAQGNIRPDRLSDVDFTLLIGGVNSPRWLAIEEDFDRLHARCSQLVQQALLRWVRDTEAGLAIGEGRLQNFSDLFDEATGSKRQNLGKDLARRLNEATSLVRDELQQTLRDSGLALDGKHELRKLSTRSPESHGSVRHMSIEDATAVHVDFARLDHLLGRALVFPEQLGPRDEPGVLPACRPELMRVDPSPEAAQGQVRRGTCMTENIRVSESWLCGLLCFALLCFALLCFALLCFALLCFALLCFALLCFALLCFACVALLCCASSVNNWQVLFRHV